VTVAFRKTIVYTRIVILACWLMHLAKSHLEVSEFLSVSVHILNTQSHSSEPAKAGRHLEKALENLRSKRNPSSSSLNTSMIVNPSTPESQGTSSVATTPIDIETFHERIASLQSDNNFLRGLVEQSSKEKCILMTTIEGLQKENSSTFLRSLVYRISRPIRKTTADILDRSEQGCRISQRSGGSVAASAAPILWRLVVQQCLHRNRRRRAGKTGV